MQLSFIYRIALAPLFLLAIASCGPKQSADPGAGGGKTILRVGHFPNITHAQGIIASELSRQGKGFFEERLGPNVELKWFTYNAGPSAMEAIFTDSVDLTYVGTGPLLNAYARSRGTDIRVIAGSAIGGAGLVIHDGAALEKAQDFRGKKIAVPQLGNTQDIACRTWLQAGGLKITQVGGDAQIIPTENPDQLGLFQSNGIDAVWTVEPWISRLELEGKGKLLVEEKTAITTVLCSGAKALREKGDLVTKFAKAHGELTEWINSHPDEAKQLFLAGMKSITKRDLSPQLLDQAWPRLTFTSGIEAKALDKLAADAQGVGYLKDAPALDKLMALPK